MLRPYQTEALEAVREHYERGLTRQLIALPTGTGKTVVFASLPNYFTIKKKIMVLVHREELAKQAAEKIEKWNPNLKVGIEMGEKISDADCDVIVASVATIGRAGSLRLLKFNPQDFEAIVCDEAHHSVADSYERIFEYFHLRDQDNKTLLLGVTATPNRGDGEPLGQVYDAVSYEMSILDAIRQGWLVPPKGFRVRSDVNLDKVRTVAGDFNQADLERAVNTAVRNELVVRAWLRDAPDRQTVAFTVDIQHAKDLAQKFCEFGVKAEPIWGTDPDRAEKIRLHKAGIIRVLTNCGVLTEGYDDPSIQCIVMARPTKSQLLYIQMAGRALRLPEGCDNLLDALARGESLTKVDAILLDTVDNTNRHTLVTLGSIFGLPPQMDLQGASALDAKDKFDAAFKAKPSLPISKLVSLDALDQLVSSVELFPIVFSPVVMGNSKLAWHDRPDGGFILLLPEGESCTITLNLLGKWEADIFVNGSSAENEFPDLPSAFKWADSMMGMLGKDHMFRVKRDTTWAKDAATHKQMALLRKFYGNKVPEGLNKVEARNLITDFIYRRRRMKGQL